MRNLLATSLIGIVGLSASCGSQNNSQLNSSVNQSIEQKWSNQMDLSKELSPNLADNLIATKSSLNTTTIGSNVGATFKFGTTAVFDIGASMKYDDIFQRQILHEVTIGRAKDEDGKGDGRGVFVDADTVAAGRFVKCKSQKVISDSNSFNASAGGGISFFGLELGTRVGTGRKLASSTDYTMNRGFYLTKKDTKLAQIFELCGDIAKSDVALQNINHINEVVKLNFNAGENLEDLAKKVARGEKVNNFQFHNMKMDYQILRRGNESITYKVYPDTYWADPVIEVEVKYKKEGARVVVQDVLQSCKSDCQNYHNSQRKHGLKPQGEDLTVEQAEKYMKLVGTIFTAVALDSK